MQGQSALSIESARRVVANVRVEQVQAFPTVEFFRTIPLLSLVRFVSGMKSSRNLIRMRALCSLNRFGTMLEA